MVLQNDDSVFMTCTEVISCIAHANCYLHDIVKNRMKVQRRTKLPSRYLTVSQSYLKALSQDLMKRQILDKAMQISEENNSVAFATLFSEGSSWGKPERTPVLSGDHGMYVTYMKISCEKWKAPHFIAETVHTFACMKISCEKWNW